MYVSSCIQALAHDPIQLVDDIAATFKIERDNLLVVGFVNVSLLVNEPPVLACFHQGVILRVDPFLAARQRNCGIWERRTGEPVTHSDLYLT